MRAGLWLVARVGCMRVLARPSGVAKAFAVGTCHWCCKPGFNPYTHKPSKLNGLQAPQMSASYVVLPQTPYQIGWVPAWSTLQRT